MMAVIIGCNSDKAIMENSVKGNWSAIIDSDYYEICFRYDTLEMFNTEWEFFPPSIYEVNNDSLIIISLLEGSKKIKYKMNFLDTNNLSLTKPDETISLRRINKNQYTVEDLLNQGYLYLGMDNPMNDYLRTKFVDSNFTVRKIEFLIENNILKKDSLLNYWNQQIADSTESSYYKYLIERIK